MKTLCLILFVFLFACTPIGYKPISSSPGEVFYSRHDDFSNVSKIRHKSFINSRKWMNPPLEVYLLKDGENYNLKMKLEYRGSSWIFFNRATLLNQDGQTVVYDINPGEVSRNILRSGMLVETADFRLLSTHAEELLSLVGSETLRLQLRGESASEYNLTMQDSQGIKDVVNKFLSSME